MAGDGVANIVNELLIRGFDPRRISDDLWEARCPAHRSADHALAITRNEFHHVLFECRSTQNCQLPRIIAALGFTIDRVYAETPDWLMSRVSRVPIQPASFKNVQAQANHEVGPISPEPPQSRLEAAEPKIPPEGGTPADDREADAGSSLGSDGSDPAQLFFAPACSSQVPALAGESFFGNALMLPASHQSSSEAAGNLERVSSVQVLTRLASSARLFRAADGRFCAQVPINDRLEIHGLKSAGFRDWLIDGYVTYQPEPPSSWAIRRVVGMLEARARYSTGIPEVFVRVGQDGDGDGGDGPYFLDLGDASGRAVAIGGQGWRIVDRPEVFFRRPEGLRPLPAPARDGSIDLLRPYVNLGESDYRLMIAWLTAALRPVGPYPILVLNGEQASGKSTLARILRLLIDPQACPVLALPKSTHDLMATALNGWLLVYENISMIADWLSDCVCQLAFGGGFASRALFTNDERSIIYAQRPVILVGIDDFVLRGDLRDRSVFLHLAPIPLTSRRTERTFWPAFRADYPRILGGVLDAIVGGLRMLPSVDLKELPRMADFAEWGEATSLGLGWGPGTFASTYNDNRKAATELVLDDSPVATVLLVLARKGINWSGTPVKLHEAISLIVNKKTAAAARWPKTMHMFGSELRRIAPQLRLHGLSVSFERRCGERIITLRSDGATASRPSGDLPPS